MERSWGSSYYITYCYAYQGLTYQREEQVNYKRYAAWPEGTRLPVRYLPQRPSKGRLEWNNTLRWYILYSLVLFFLGVLLVLVSPFSRP